MQKQTHARCNPTSNDSCKLRFGTFESGLTMSSTIRCNHSEQLHFAQWRYKARTIQKRMIIARIETLFNVVRETSGPTVLATADGHGHVKRAFHSEHEEKDYTGSLSRFSLSAYDDVMQKVMLSRIRNSVMVSVWYNRVSLPSHIRSLGRRLYRSSKH